MHPEGCWKNLCGESRKTYTCDYADGFLFLVPAKNGNTHTQPTTFAVFCQRNSLRFLEIYVLSFLPRIRIISVSKI